MVDAVAMGQAAAVKRPRLDVEQNILTIVLFAGLLGAGVLFAVYSLQTDIAQSGAPIKTWAPFLLLGVALLIALGFEFVNGFHDTANAVATVIYTHSMPAHVAVVWSGCFNFLGVLLSSVPLPSASSRCWRWSSSCRSARGPALPWSSPC